MEKGAATVHAQAYLCLVSSERLFTDVWACLQDKRWFPF